MRAERALWNPLLKRREPLGILLPDLCVFHFQVDSSQVEKNHIWTKEIYLLKSKSLMSRESLLQKKLGS